MYKILLALIIIIFAYSCKNETDNAITFNKIKGVSIHLDDPNYNIPSDAQYAEIDNKDK
jgi:hypothetical protein